MAEEKQGVVFSGLPVHGYQNQPEDRVALVNANKVLEEKVLRAVDEHFKLGPENLDMRFVYIALTHFQQGFMALNRAVFRPQRIRLPEDPPEGDGRPEAL